MVGAQQFVRCVVFHHGDLQPVKVLEVARFGAAFVGEDDNGKVQIRPCEGQETLALLGGHDAGQQVELVVFGLFEHGGPVGGLDQFDPDAQAVLDQAYIVGGKAL